MNRLSRPVKRGQEFIHKYYETIKLTLLLIIILMAGVLIYGMLDQAADDRARRAEEQAERVKVVQEVLQKVDDNTDEVLARVERSESLLCALFLQHDIDIKLPDDLRDRCQRELEERGVTSQEFTSEHSHDEPAQNSPSTQTPTQEPEKKPQSNSQNNNQNNGNNNPPNPPSNPSLPERVIDGINGIVDNTVGRLF